MKIVVAPDKFKGSLTAKQVAEAIRRGLLDAHPNWNVRTFPMADGGDGTMECLVDATGGHYGSTVAKDPIGRSRNVEYGILGDGLTCVAELASSSGLTLLAPHERDPLRASTFGFGQLIRAGLDAGARRFILCLGGSATNDGGAGMLQALGFGLLGDKGLPIGLGGEELRGLRILTRDGADPRLTQCEWIAACDVNNPLLGLHGASAVFGPQKGATAEMVGRLDEALSNWADILTATTGIRVHDMPGAGAAGGVAAALAAALGARLAPGVRICLEASGIERELAGADLVITGEGRIDSQTLSGKTPLGVAQAARNFGVPVLLVGGDIADDVTLEHWQQYGVRRIIGLREKEMSMLEAISQASRLLENRMFCFFRDESEKFFLA
ncbi:glycerate kinase [Cohnella faecalis]|uniref:Glycerate kinase n=1 Tax=Cohnella faecalis TaxID=2315694 RepID=A0A398CF07_9BACL|nr:glycerate kinase [Cohnella faecalis]RIE01313.1 glycerate kinase [Cohnella faecalis]